MKNRDFKVSLLFLALTAIFMLIIGAAISTLAATPTRVRVADKAEYARYIEYCKTPVQDVVTQVGKIKVIKVGGYYFDREGKSTIKPGADTIWYKAYPSADSRSIGRKYTFEPYEKMVTRKVTFTTERRKSSVRDFYEWWMVTDGLGRKR